MPALQGESRERGSPIHTTRSCLTSVARTEMRWTIIPVDNMRIGGRLDII